MPSPTLADYRATRIEMELRRAEAIERADAYARRWRARVWLVTLAGYAAGMALMAGSYSIYGQPWADVALYGGLSLSLGGPFFTWVVALTVGGEQGLWD